MSVNNVTLTLLHTNDLHSHFEELSRIAGFIKQVRETTNSEQLLVVDCGDFLDRVRVETEGTQASANRAALEYIGYDALLLGNNEGLSYTPGQLEQIFEGMPIPIVCANMTLSKSGQCPPWMIPTYKIVKSGIRIGLIGVTAPFNEYYDLLGWNAADPFDTVRKEAERLRPEVDVLIVLSHLGLRQDERMATSIEGIDFILGGHTHHLLEVPLLVGSTQICAAGKFGGHIGHLNLEFDANNKLINISGGSKSTEDFPRESGLDSLIERYRGEASLKMNKQIAYLSESLEYRSDQESVLPTLLAYAVRQVTSAEIGLVNAGQLLEGLPAGKVTEETIHAICPSPINACVTMLQGYQIVKALEESLLPEFQQLEIRGFGFRGRVLGMLCLDGLEVTVDPSRAPLHRITAIKVNGVALDEKKMYSVGTLDMFTFGVGYIGLKEGVDTRYFLPDFIRDILSRALNQKEWITNCRKPRWLQHSMN
ncbi:bifunctional metallophosphatase/5'-nucleotidase [Cohnella abietis]|uniref:Putative metallophosphoesterase YunD n=1 Tax=Cohnella abietis TaxID=2507935 RepID=A0A3T1D2S8_9BACL|nr:bifunctional UDP-sugar hydrolase/5'-nucleotidase [Cohnella abietis]BBI32394.1 putative metallophosphoesterase YunD [Cohnella abietis]